MKHGDWNVVQEQEKDTYNVKNLNNPQAQRTIRKLKNEMEVVNSLNLK